ncbi:MAG: ECF-type sigma factor [Myxococcota bacterium]|nr:ECF-type sigma factor [Myxococcota bacterium]
MSQELEKFSSDGVYLPVEEPEFVEEFFTEHFAELQREAERLCLRHGMEDFADDALCISVEKFMSSLIEDRGPRSGIAFAMTIVKNTVIDESRRRRRQAVLGGGMTGDLDAEEHPGAWLPEPRSSSNPEAEVLASLELHALRLGFEELPRALRATHKNVERDLEIVRLRYLDGVSWEEIGEHMPIEKTHRQSAARGRELLRGWVHALCETQPEPDAANRKYWQRGFEQGMAYRQHQTWPPRAL